MAELVAATSIADHVVDALSFGFGMFWEILWALIVGFALSAARVQAVVSKGEIRRLLRDGLGAIDRARVWPGQRRRPVPTPRSRSRAPCFARGERHGGDGVPARLHDPVIELGIVMALILGWQFTLAEFFGGPLMIVLLALAFRAFVSARLVEEARAHADRGVLGRMEGHAEMEMSIQENGSLWRRLRSPEGLTSPATSSSWTGRPSGPASSAVC